MIAHRKRSKRQAEAVELPKQINAELAAYYARLYGLTRDELRYILDPQDVYGLDFPGETFRVLKEKEIRKYGEYRTRRLVLDAWGQLEGLEIGSPKEAQKASPAMPSVKEEIPLKAVATVPARVEARHTPREETAQPESHPTLSVFSLFKCLTCGKMVIGFDKDTHEREKHQRQWVKWKKIR